MKRVLVLFSAAALLLFIFGGAPATAQKVIVNDSFELHNTAYWTHHGNLVSTEYGVEQFDTNGNTKQSWAYWQSPYTGHSGGLEQTVYLLAGVTYELKVDVCYHNC